MLSKAGSVQNNFNTVLGILFPRKQGIFLIRRIIQFHRQDSDPCG